MSTDSNIKYRRFQKFLLYFQKQVTTETAYDILKSKAQWLEGKNMTDTEQRVAAAKFTEDWKSRGDEKQETQRFWIELLTKVFGVDGSTAISFEVPVKLDHTSFIDGYIESTRVLIEQKGQDIDLRKGYKQSDGSMLTPYQQARRYAGYLPHDNKHREYNIQEGLWFLGSGRWQPSCFDITGIV